MKEKEKERGRERSRKKWNDGKIGKINDDILAVFLNFLCVSAGKFLLGSHFLHSYLSRVRQT